jgi:hypothetical protein
MCAWERFCAFAREPERRLVGGDARLTMQGVLYEVDPDLAGETVLLWWGLFDQDLYVEHGERRYGPYSPAGGPIPLHKYRKYQKPKSEERADRVAALAERLGLPRAALDGDAALAAAVARPVEPSPAKTRFTDPDPFYEFAYPNVVSAKRAVADEIGLPLAKLSPEDRAFVDALVRETLTKTVVLTRVRARFKGRDRC